VESESAKHVIALNDRVMYDTESCDEEQTYKELDASYKELYAKNAKICQLLEKQNKTTSQLQAERSDHLAKTSELNDEVTQLNFQLEHVKKQVKMMTTGTDVLEEILEGQNKGKPKGINFDYKPLNKKQRNINFAYALEDYGMVRKQKQVQDIKFVAAAGTDDPTMSKQILQHPEEHQSSKSKKISRPLVCHYCRRKSHIRPCCMDILSNFSKNHLNQK